MVRETGLAEVVAALEAEIQAKAGVKAVPEFHEGSRVGGEFNYTYDDWVTQGKNQPQPRVKRTMNVFLPELSKKLETLIGSEDGGPITKGEIILHEDIHWLQAFYSQRNLFQQFLAKEGFGSSLFFDSDGKAYFYISKQLKSEDGKLLAFHDVPVKQDAMPLVLENAWNKLLDSYARRFLSPELAGRTEAENRAIARSDLAEKVKGIEATATADRLLVEVHAYIAAYHRDISSRVDLDAFFKRYLGKTEEQRKQLGYVMAAADNVVRAYAALEQAGVTGAAAHTRVTKLVGESLVISSDPLEPYAQLSQNLTRLARQLGVPEPDQEAVSEFWTKLGERNERVVRDRVLALGRFADSSLQVSSLVFNHLEASAGCEQPTLSHNTKQDLAAKQTANGSYEVTAKRAAVCN